MKVSSFNEQYKRLLICKIKERICVKGRVNIKVCVRNLRYILKASIEPGYLGKFTWLEFQVCLSFFKQLKCQIIRFEEAQFLSSAFFSISCCSFICYPNFHYHIFFTSNMNQLRHSNIEIPPKQLVTLNFTIS